MGFQSKTLPYLLINAPEYRFDQICQPNLIEFAWQIFIITAFLQR